MIDEWPHLACGHLNVRIGCVNDLDLYMDRGTPREARGCRRLTRQAEDRIMNKPVSLLCLCISLAACNQQSSEPKVNGRWYTQSQVNSGKQLYAEHCVSCHLDNAQGTSNWKETTPDGKYPPPPLNGTAHAWHHPLSVLKRVIAEGGIRLGGKMPAFGDKLNEQEALTVISYLQSFWKDEIYSAWISRGGLN